MWMTVLLWAGLGVRDVEIVVLQCAPARPDVSLILRGMVSAGHVLQNDKTVPFRDNDFVPYEYVGSL